MDALFGLPREQLERFNRELAGEAILWAGRPSPRAAFWKSVPIWLFAIPWLVFSLGWEAIALGAFFNTGVGKVEGPGGILSFVFPIFGLPFVVIGIGMVGMPFWAARRAGQTVHVLTPGRLVTAVLGRALEVKSFLTARVVSIKRVERSDGSGTITFCLGCHRDSDGDLAEKNETWFGVPGVASLEAHLRGVVGQRDQER